MYHETGELTDLLLVQFYSAVMYGLKDDLEYHKPINMYELYLLELLRKNESLVLDYINDKQHYIDVDFY